MDGKLLRGVTGGVQPLRLYPEYQDAIFAWSGEFPFTNLAQGGPYKILPRSQYNSDWLHSTPYGRSFRSPTFNHSEGYVFSSHVPNGSRTYKNGVTGYVEFIYTGAPASGQNAQHFTVLKSSADENTNSLYFGVIAFGCELVNSSMRHFFRLANNEPFVGFAGGVSTDAVPINVPAGARVRQMATFNPADKSYSAIMAFDDVVYTTSGVLSYGFSTNGTTALIGGYTRFGSIRTAYVSGMLSAAVWNRTIPLTEMRALLERQSIFQPKEIILPFSFGESSTDNLITIYPSDLSLNSSGLSPLQEHSIEPSNISLSSNTLSTLASVDILHGSVELTSNNIELSQQILLSPGTYIVTGNGLTTKLYIDITKGSVVTQGNSILIDTGYPSNIIGITQGNVALLGSDILTNTNINVSPSSVTSSGNQVNIARYIEILAGNSSMVGSNIYIDTDFPYLNIDITPSNISTLGNQIILDRVANLVINKGDISTLGSNILVHTQADNLINIAYGSIEVLGSGVVVISGEPYDSGRRLGVTKRDYILRVRGKYVLRVI